MGPETLLTQKKSENFGVNYFFLGLWGSNRKSGKATFRSRSLKGLSKFLDITDLMWLRIVRKTPQSFGPPVVSGLLHDVGACSGDNFLVPTFDCGVCLL